MFSKILIKLIDESIVPAVLILSMRIISIVLVSQAMGTQISLGPAGFIFTDAIAYKKINSYSILTMIVCITLGIFFILAKAYMFHETHIKPGITARLFSYNLNSLIQNSFILYSQGAIWISYLFLLILITGVMAFLGSIYTWVAIFGFFIFLVSIVLFIIDIEKEIKRDDSGKPIYDTDTSFLENV